MASISLNAMATDVVARPKDVFDEISLYVLTLKTVPGKENPINNTNKTVQTIITRNIKCTYRINNVAIAGIIETRWSIIHLEDGIGRGRRFIIFSARHPLTRPLTASIRRIISR